MAEQIRLVWTLEPPTQIGYYWIELTSGRNCIGELSDWGEGVHFLVGDIPYWYSEIKRYAGPIAEPDELEPGN